jgi:geranylgeranylglycerol-phosphate geranylgeranyltransferase
MNFLYLLLSNFLFFNNINKCYPYQNNILKINQITKIKKNNFILNSKNNKITEKIKNISILTRSNNILSTFFLSFCGGWLVEPSFDKLIHSTQFLSINLICIVVLLLSMIINDLADIELDKINNPNRPLVSGAITKKEAIGISIFFYILIEFLSFSFLSSNLQNITNIILFGLLLYTPIFKKITFIKNLFCAFIVSFTLYYSSFAIKPEFFTNNIILLTAIKYIFLGSLSIELLLDITDKDGDKKNNIKTIPVIFGKEITWYNVLFLTLINMINIFLFANGYYKFIVILFFPLIFDIIKIKKSNFDKFIIKKTIKNTTIPMVFMLLYFCFLSSTSYYF